MKKYWLSFLLLSLSCQPALAQNVVRWATSGDIPTLDPYAFASTSALAFQNHIYEALLQRDNDLNLQPTLATHWEYVNDTTLRFTLRQGVKFQNGDDFEADDVVASIARATDPDSGVRANVSSIKNAVAVDKYTVDIHLKEKSGIALNELSGVLIMDKSWMAQHNALKPTSISQGTEGYATNNTNGTGPFMLESRQRDAQMILKKNPGWWNRAQSQNNIDEIIFKPVSSDATRLSGILAGEYDLVTNVPLQDIDRLKLDPKLTTLVSPSLRVDFLAFNLRDKLNAGNTNGKNPLQDLRVRQALMMAINREAIVKKIMRGMTSVANTYLAPAIPGYDPKSAIALPYNPAKAKQLLSDAGFPQGFPLQFDCVEGAYINAPQWCQAVQGFWSKIGVKTTMNVHPYSVYNQITDNGKTDIAVIGWANLPIMDAHNISVQLLHTNDNTGFGMFNLPRYSNPRVDQLIEASLPELDQAKRVEMLRQEINLAQSDLPYIPMHFEPVVWVVSKQLTLKQSPDNVVRLWYGQFK
ncbi:Dipeptide-binding ABC transporter, periplasmic substrate-binding component [Paramixta manurensis]|uniref:Dipeptide-binding ABC transporter, periplasmic substrate-binding component n=1 Tax=Paramixta manurensis TaxID=2740817 RepID=A0A6M8U2T0_9GAMM|nr:Dipeptide-binding ABC transporter, periplasmic substrate-binding component [Erwiniaceae bacterium PD-1]